MGRKDEEVTEEEIKKIAEEEDEKEQEEDEDENE